MRFSLLLIFTAFLFLSCSEYQKILKSDDAGKKYVYAESLYKEGKYKKALNLMEQIVPVYRGKPQAEKLMFMYANTFYNMEDFYLSGYQFERFVTTYPKSDSTEFAAYRSAESYYKLSPKFSLDQKETYQGLEKLQDFINKYPNSQYRVDANEKVSELREKLEKKDIEIARQYLKIVEYTRNYKAAIESFDNFISDHPGSKYRKDAFFGRLQASYQQAIKSHPSQLKERLIISKKYYYSFIKYYSDSELKTDADKILEDIDRRLTNKEPSS